MARATGLIVPDTASTRVAITDSRQTDRYHAITQTTRHVGHADLLRERIDSAVDE